MSFPRDQQIDFVDVRAEGTVWRVEFIRIPSGIYVLRIEDMPVRIYADAFRAEIQRLAVAKLTEFGELVAA